MPEPVRLFAAIFHDTDGYTYDCDVVLGIYSIPSLADERCLKDQQEFNWRKLEDYHVEEYSLDQDWQ